MLAFPAFIPLYDARIVIVGDGEAAEAKHRLVARSIAEVTRVGADRALDPAVYAGARLAFIAVEDEAQAAEAARIARAAGALVNVVDRQELGDFHTPAIVDRSPVIAAIGTGGAAPLLATLLRGQIEARWPEGLGRLAELSQSLQAQAREALPDLAARRAFWRRVLTGPAARAAYEGDMEAARTLAVAELEGRAPGQVWLLEPPERPELLTLAAVRALGAADRIVAGAEVAGVADYGRRDAHRETDASPDQLAAWAEAGEQVVIVAHKPGLVPALRARGVAAERLPVGA